MNSNLLRLAPRRFAKALAAAALAAAAALPAWSVNHEQVVPPIAPGRFAVACSNIAQNADRIAAAGVPAEDFWEGRDRYLGEVLSHPNTALRFGVAVPNDRGLYARFAGLNVEFVAIVCHPTSRANTDPNYVLPGSASVVPRMQLPGASPKLISQGELEATLGLREVGFGVPLPTDNMPAQLPLIVYSHGLSGSPISKGYIDVMVQLAAQGYMVAAIFHGDPRFSRVRLEDLGDYFYAIVNFERVVEMQAMRPLSLRVMTDLLVTHPGFSPGIDRSRIGGFGASMGGQAMAHLLGAHITSSLSETCRETARDPRIRAAVGFVPYAGHPVLCAFCEDQSGARHVGRPFLALTGSADSTAPESMMLRALDRFQGSRYLVSLQGGRHELRAEDAGDLFTWMVTFLNAYLEVPWDPGAMARLIRMAGVQGGREEVLRRDVHVPQATGEEVVAREFHNIHLDHYFLAAGQDEIDILTSGGGGGGWQLTGESFKVWPRMPSDTFVAAAPVCRFYGGLNGGPNSHFFTAESGECDLVRRAGGWFYEGIGFYIRPVLPDGTCPAGYLEVNRAYNNRFLQNDSNHRFTTSDSTLREMARRGWVIEGTVMCARP